jgi:hypothetical protein
MGENNTLDRPATPEEIEMVELLLKRTRPAVGSGSSAAMTTESRRPPTVGPYRSRGKVPFGPRKKSVPGSRTSVRRATRRSGAFRARQTMTITYLIAPDPALKRLAEATPSGMAHWSGTGPPGTVCGQCSFYGYGVHPNSCYRYYEGVLEHGAALPAETPSCQRFALPGRDEILRR